MPKRGDVPKEKPGTESLRKDRAFVTKYASSDRFSIEMKKISLSFYRYASWLLSSVVVWIRCTWRWQNCALPTASALTSQSSNTSLCRPSSCSHSWRWDSTSTHTSEVFTTALFRSQHPLNHTLCLKGISQVTSLYWNVNNESRHVRLILFKNNFKLCKIACCLICPVVLGF